MSNTRVSNICLTVSTVKAFIKIMKLISEYELWDDTEAYLKENGKTDMFVDFELLFLFREMLEQGGRVDPDHPAFKLLADHDDPHFNRFIRKYDSE